MEQKAEPAIACQFARLCKKINNTAECPEQKKNRYDTVLLNTAIAATVARSAEHAAHSKCWCCCCGSALLLVEMCYCVEARLGVELKSGVEQKLTVSGCCTVEYKYEDKKMLACVQHTSTARKESRPSASSHMDRPANPHTRTRSTQRSTYTHTS